MKTLKLSIILLLLGFTTAQAQVGINTTNPDTTAILHIYSDNKGVLLPTVSSDVRSALSGTNAPTAEGLLVYDSIGKVYYFFNRATKEWLALNPFQTTEKDDATGAGGDNVKLATPFQNRNVVIGGDTADSNAKLHVKGNIKSDSTLYGRNASISDSTWSTKVGATTANISDSIRTKKINADTVRANVVYGAVPVGTIVMWDSASIPPCWERVTGMDGRFPVGVGGVGDGITYNSPRSTTDNSSNSGRNQVALTESQMPRHTHIQVAHNHVISPNNTGTGSYTGLVGNNSSGSSRSTEETTAVNEYTGGTGIAQAASDGANHENRPPFYSVYFIRKTSNNCPN